MSLSIDEGLGINARIIAINPVGEAERDDRASIELSSSPMYYEREDRPGDAGWIDGVPICRVTRGLDGRIRHHVEGDLSRFHPKSHVRVVLDANRRAAIAARLGAGGLITAIGSEAFVDLHAVSASYWPNRSYVEFGASEYIPPPDLLLPRFNAELDRALRNDMPFVVIPQEHSQLVQFQLGKYPPCIASGPFPGNVKDIGQVVITRIVAKGGLVQVRFRAGMDASALRT